MKKFGLVLTLLFSMASYCQNDSPIHQTASENSDRTIYKNPQVEAEFPGGKDKMNLYINKQILKSTAYLENNLSGKFLIRFIVEIDGSFSDINVVGGTSFAQNAIAKIVQRFPKFLPAEHEGYKVRSSFSFPIVIPKNE